MASAGADDAETDDSLRNRARSFFTTARRGTLFAIQQGALAVGGVRTAAAFEVLDALGRPAKAVQLVIADAFTQTLVNASPTPPTYQAQSQILCGNVLAALEDTRAGGIAVTIQLGIVVLQSVQVALHFVAGVNYSVVALQARSAIVNAINSLSPGQVLLRSTLLNALRGVVGLIVTGDEVYSPPGDVRPSPLQVLRTSLNLVLIVGQAPASALSGSSNPDAP